MSVPNTENTALLFVTRAPAWEKGVSLKQTIQAGIFTARSGLTQRQGRHSRSRWEMQYSAVLDRAAAEARVERTLAEIRAPLVVPFWSEPALSVSTLEADAVTIDRDPDDDFFSAGDWIYIAPAGEAGEFRLIASTAGAVLTLEPLDGSLDYGVGVTIYPCRFWTRGANGATFESADDESVLEPLLYSTL